MVGQAESSSSSVNEKLARAREQDLRRCRNLQAKLRRARGRTEAPSGLVEPALPFHRLPEASSSSRAGLLFLSSTQQAQRERDQRSRERQLKRQVAGPIPPESWRSDFDRLSIRRGLVAPSATALLTTASDHLEDGEDSKGVRRPRSQRAAVCSSVRSVYDDPAPLDSGTAMLSLGDTALCVVADAINRPSFGRAHGKSKQRDAGAEMDIDQIREVLAYLPRHMHERMLALCGRLAATDWPLADWTAQALLEHTDHASERREQAEASHGDWDDDDSASHASSVASNTTSGIGSCDLSFATISTRTLNRMLLGSGGQSGVSLRVLSLAGWNSGAHSSSALDSTSMLTILSQLPNLELVSLADSHLDARAPDTVGTVDPQRAAVFLRKLSRILPKLRRLDLSYCGWVSADAVLGVSWATADAVAWPRLEQLILVGCEAFIDPGSRDALGKREHAGAYVATWHATHSQRAMQEAFEAGPMLDPYSGVLHRGDPFDLFATPTRQPARATFADYVKNTLQPAVVSRLAPEDGRLIEAVRCPRSAGRVDMWQWQRARILDAIRGRLSAHARQRRWVEVWF